MKPSLHPETCRLNEKCLYLCEYPTAGWFCVWHDTILPRKNESKILTRMDAEKKNVPFYEGFLCTLNWYNSCRRLCCSDKAANLLSAGINEAALFPRRAACPLAPRCDRTMAFKNAAADRGTRKPRQDQARIARAHDVQSEFRRAGESH